MRHVPLLSVDCIPVPLIGVVFACLGLTAGCTTTSPTVSEPATVVLTEPLPLDTTPVVRYGRYTLVELAPLSAQDDLMQQLVDITFPAAVISSVADALRYVLFRSGYQLSDDCIGARVLDAFPLPAAHQHLGPLTLRTVLQILVGSAWQLQIDNAWRQVCVMSITDSVGLPSAQPPDVAGHQTDGVDAKESSNSSEPQP